MRSIDINSDLGEGAGHDPEIMRFVSSANIACGGHAGDEDTMRETVALAMKHGVSIGAHPGYPDKANFGRENMDLDPLAHGCGVLPGPMAHEKELNIELWIALGGPGSDA